MEPTNRTKHLASFSAYVGPTAGIVMEVSWCYHKANSQDAVFSSCCYSIFNEKNCTYSSSAHLPEQESTGTIDRRATDTRQSISPEQTNSAGSIFRVSFFLPALLHTRQKKAAQGVCHFPFGEVQLANFRSEVGDCLSESTVKRYSRFLLQTHIITV